MAKKPGPAKVPPHVEARNAGLLLVQGHALLGWLARGCHVVEDGAKAGPGWAAVTPRGTIFVNPGKRGAADEWAWVFAHLSLHLGFGHFPCEARKHAWNAACCVAVDAFLHAMKVGRPPPKLAPDPSLFGPSERALYERFTTEGVPPAAEGARDLLEDAGHDAGAPQLKMWQENFARGLRYAVEAAVDPGASRGLTQAERARRWFMASYPLLGALASSFRIVEDAGACRRLDVQVAAVSERSREIYVSPNARLDDEEMRFVLAHELLHVGLRHDARRKGRDPWLWNCACDFVINGWLVEMKVGKPPALGLLLDDELARLSAESVYDRIVNDLRRFRRLSSLRGVGLCDMLDGVEPAPGDPTDLDAFYRRCMSQGLLAHQATGRGLLPAGLVEEIWAVAEPPIPWDVQLARLFDAWFPPLEPRRTYARPSRRQGATPDIPRPRVAPLDEEREARTFAVVLDSSGSMDRGLLGQALGAIASYAVARDVPLVRLVYCDARPYDEGYLPPEAIAGRLGVKGRGGTVLQPALDLLDGAEDFPPQGPVLVITDGQCDVLRVGRPHAFLLPAGGHLPFPAKGPVFYVE